jgi:AIG2-like family
VPLYFAYGSNMDSAAMAKRCPKSRVMGLARLPRHRFFIMSEGYASIKRDPRRAVLGVLWDVPLSDMPALDRYESLHSGLYTKIDQPVIIDQAATGSGLVKSTSKRALLYVGRSDKAGKPKAGYLEAVIAAARAQGLPDGYLYELEHGEPAPRKVGAPLFKAPM